ncbi:MAG: hypothetical protein ACHQ2Z_07300 [Elusimicrobiota bacterium]
MKRWMLAAALLAGAPATSGAVGAYDVFPTAAIGTARTVALGGATSAVDPDGYEAVFANPAGMSGMAGKGLDFGSDSNHVDNYVVDLNDPKARSLDDPIQYSYGGVRYVTNSGWGLGAAVSTPFNYDDSFSGTTKIVKGQSTFVGTADENDVHTVGSSYAVGAGKSFLDGRFGFGADVNYTQAKTNYSFTPVTSTVAAFGRSASADAWSADFGVLVRPYRWLRLGALYKMGYRVPLGSNNTGLPVAFNAFRDLKTPDRLLFGLRLAPVEYLRIFLQGRFIFGMNGTVITGSDSFPGTTGNTVAYGRITTLDGACGIEYVPYDVDDLTVRLRAGGYVENTGVVGGYVRYHRTAGFAFEPWFFNLSMAIDEADNYNNFVVGVGVDILGVAKRVSKVYGWNLPL